MHLLHNLIQSNTAFIYGDIASRESAMFHPHMDFETKNLQFFHRNSFLLVFTIFGIIMFFTICFIYSLYVWIYRWQLSLDQALSHWVTPNSVRSGANMEIEISTGPAAGLDPVVISSLPIVSFGSGSGKCKEVDCAICLCSFQDGEKVKVLPECYHAFHCECLDRWLVSQSNCPLCRASVNYSDHYEVSNFETQDVVQRVD